MELVGFTVLKAVYIFVDLIPFVFHIRCERLINTLLHYMTDRC